MAGSLPLKNDVQLVTQFPQSRRQALDVVSAAESVLPISSDRDIWKTVCDTGLRSFVNGWITTSEERRAARHTISTKPKTGPRCRKCSRVCASDFRLRSHMRSHDKTGNT